MKKQTKCFSKNHIAATLATLALATAPMAQASITWGGSGSTTTTTDFNLGSNWQNGTAPANQDLVFSTTGNAAPSLTAILTAKSLTYNSGASAFNLGGGSGPYALTLDANAAAFSTFITDNNTANTETISGPLTLKNSNSSQQGAISAAANTTLVISGVLTIGQNINNLFISGAGKVTLSGGSGANGVDNSGEGVGYQINNSSSGGTLNFNTSFTSGSSSSSQVRSSSATSIVNLGVNPGVGSINVGVFSGATTGGFMYLSANGITVDRALTMNAASAGSTGTVTFGMNVNGTASATFSGTATLNANASGAVTDALYVNDNNTLTMSGVISGGSATVNTTSKTGNGTLILNNANTYTSPTVVSAGTLLANKTTSGSSTGTGSVTVNSGATFGSSVAGRVSGAVSYLAGSHAVFTVTPSGGVNTTPMTLGSTLTISTTATIPDVHLNLPTGLSPGTYTLATYTSSGSSGSFTATPVIDSGSFVSGGTATVSTSGGSVTLNVVGPVDHFAISPLTIASATAGTGFNLASITAQDSANQTVTGFASTVTFSGTAGVTGTSGSFVNGVLSSPSVTPTSAGSSKTIIVTDANGKTGSATITTVSAGSVSASQSTVSANPTTVTANGSSTSTITVTLKDANGNPVSGKTVTLASSRGGIDSISGASGTSTSLGVVTFTVASVTTGSPFFTATDTTDNVTVSQTASVTFTLSTITWGGTGSTTTTTDFDLASNWQGATSPSGQALVFGTTGNTAPALTAILTANSMTFNSGAPAFNIAGGSEPYTLTLDANSAGFVQIITDNAANMETISGPITLKNSNSSQGVSINAAANTTLVISGVLTIGQNINNLYIGNSAGTVTLSGGSGVNGVDNSGEGVGYQINNSSSGGTLNFNTSFTSGSSSSSQVRSSSATSIVNLGVNPGVGSINVGVFSTTPGIATGGFMYLSSNGITVDRPLTMNAGGPVGTGTVTFGMNVNGTASATFSGTATLNANASGAVTDALYVNDNNTLTMSGVISGGSATVNTTSKTGNGTLILTGQNTYTSPTTVTAGTLLANTTTSGQSSTGTGSVTVNSGATFGSSVAGRVSGAVSYLAGSHAVFTVTPSGGANTTQMTLGSTLTVASSGTIPDVHLNLPTGLSPGTYTLATYTLSGSSGLFNATPVIDSGLLVSGGTATVSTSGGNVTLNVVGPVDHFAISPATIISATAGTAFNLTSITAQDTANQTVTSFASTVTFSGTAGVTGTSGSFVNGVLSNPSVTPTSAGSSKTIIVTDANGKTGSATITTVTGIIVPNLTYNNAPGIGRQIAVSDMLAAGLASSQSSPSYTITLPSGTSAQGGSVITDGSRILYTPSGTPSSDTFSYTVSDGTASATATVTISFASVAGGQIDPALIGSDGADHARFTFHGIPNTAYHVQRATTLTPTPNWSNADAGVTTGNDGSYLWTDTTTITSLGGSVYYRISYP